jgi:uncharacterized protein (TIGR00661 family)
MRIAYAINGEGMGHATRSSVVIDHVLKQGHEVAIFSAGTQQVKYLRSKFDSVAEVVGLHMIYRDNKVMRLPTALRALNSMRSFRRDITTIRDQMIMFRPEVVITDFDFHGEIIARLFHIPLIAIDNIQFITEAKFSVAPEDLVDYELSYMVAKMMVPRFDHAFVTTFCNAELRNPAHTDKVTFVPPLLRPSILAMKPSKKDHILVYQTSDSHVSLDRVLTHSKESFIVYKAKHTFHAPNVITKPFDEKTFVADLASAKAIIINGGFNVITEGLYFKKPILSIPIRNHFEQRLNGLMLQEHGLGLTVNRLSRIVLEEFVQRAPRFEEALKHVSFDNTILFTKLETTLASLRDRASR